MLHAIAKFNDEIRVINEYNDTVCTLSLDDYAEEYEAEGTAYAIRDLLNSTQGKKVLLGRVNEAKRIFQKIETSLL